MGFANYNLPENKLLKVQHLSKAKSKREAIVIALDEYLERKKIEHLMALKGKLKLNWTRSSLKKYRG